MKSIYLKNFITTAILITICLGLVVGTFLTAGHSFVVRENKDAVDACAEEIAHTAEAFSETDSLSSWVLSMTLTTISSSTGNSVFVTDENGMILCCSDKSPVCAHIGRSVPDPVVKNACDMGKFEGSGTLDGLYETEMYFVCVPVESSADGVICGYVIVSASIQSSMSDWAFFRTASLAISFVILAFVLVAVMAYSKHMSRPLDEMAAASRRFARGDFSVRVVQNENTSDEMGALIESFNKMADSLEKAENRRSQFIANVSHELRTPMTTIAGFADGILDGTIPPEDEKKYLVSIRNETRRLSRLVREMLDVSQTRERVSDEARRTVFNICELAIQTLLSFETRAMEKNLDVDPQIPDNDILVRADRDAITRVIYNLLDNAVKFASVGSCLVLKIYKEGSKALVAVRDYGETIPEDDIPFIFDRFHKSDRSRSLDKDGVGLGLYFVKEIINSHDEDIAVKSENGMTEFVFSLPLAE